MDSWKSHLWFGLIFEVLFIGIMYFWKGWFLPAEGTILISILQLIIICGLSPLFLDIDHRMGKLREGLTIFGLVIGLIGVTNWYFKYDYDILMVYGLIISSVSYLLAYTTVHRGYVHTVWFVLIYAGLTGFFLNNIQYGILAFVGCYSHMIADKIPFKILP